jgi:hypothetical protein
LRELKIKNIYNILIIAFQAFQKPSTSDKRTSTAVRLKRKKLMETRDEIMRNCTESLTRSCVPDEYEAIGISIAAKLRKMNYTQKLLAEGLINKVLMKGIFDELSRDTDIADNLQPPRNQHC